MPPFLTIDALDKRFGDHVVLRDISLAVEEGETLALLGPSGSGKTTLLRLIAGFEAPNGGAIRAAGRDITVLAPAQRNFGMVFQHYALFPHLSVAENVAFGLASRRTEAGERRERVERALALVDLDGFEDRRVHEISGGQQQRVALARALAPRPQILLLDEPLSNLDPTLRERTRDEIRGTLRQVGITAVWVTHEQDEAFDVGDRVAVLHQGNLEQLGTPEELYLEPASPFVARFVGRASALAGELTAAGKVRIVLPAGEVEWDGEGAAEVPAGSAVELFVRPEGLELGPPDADNALAGRIARRRYAGSVTFYTVELIDGSELELVAEASAAGEGDRVSVAPAASGPRPRWFAEAGR